MAQSSTTLLITTPGLKKVSRELINKRVFVSSKITKIGNPMLTSDGIASGFTPLITGQSTPAYFKRNNLFFTNSDNLRVAIEGKFVSKVDDVSNCFWSLTGTDDSSLNLEVCSNKIQLWNNNTAIASIVNMSIADSDKVKVELSLTINSCTITAIINNESIYTNSVTFSEPVSFSPLTSALIGVKDDIGSYYWQGSIDLSSFIIYKNDKIFYSPSIDNIFKFTKITICDASVTLTDSTREIVNHCYELPISEIKRTNNNILISAQIPSESYLNINKIGLYSTGEDGTQLFALLDNLTIKKTRGLGYNLILNVSIDLNVVNTLIMPDFVLNEIVESGYVDFDNIKKIFTIAETDLERMIKENAKEVGYKKAQVNYRLEDNIELIEDNYMAVRNFLRAADDFQIIEKDVFDYSKAKVYEPLTIKDSIASDFTTSNYVTPQYMAIGGTNPWEFVVPFITSSNTETPQTIISALSCNEFNPFEIYIDNNYCKVQISKPETISFTSGDSTLVYIRNSEKTTMNGTDYYFWTAADPSSSEYTYQMIYTTAWKPTSASNFYYLDDETITPISGLTFQKYERGTIITKPIFAVDPVTKYYIKVVYTGTEYKFYKSSNGEDYIITDTENMSTEMATSNNICIGVLYIMGIHFVVTISNPFKGGIDLAGLYLNKPGSETTGMILEDTDEDQYIYNKTEERYFGWSYTSGGTTYTIYTKTQDIISTTVLYNIDGTVYTGSDFIVTCPTGQTEYEVQYQGHSTSRGASYYIWSADETSYSIQKVYTRDPDPISESRLYKLVSGALVEISRSELSFVRLIIVPVASITNLAKSEIINNSVLEDYFHIPTYKYSKFRVINLCNNTSKLEVLDCSITGNKIDNIDFSSDRGFTLLAKVYLKEIYDEFQAVEGAITITKTILAKTSLNNTYYLNLSLSCNANKSIFTLTASLVNDTFSISKEISAFDIDKYISDYILLTLTFNPDSSSRLLSLYKNNSLIASQLIPVGTSIGTPSSNDKITNYLSTTEMANANSCISDIIFIDGSINEMQLYYLTNLLDCNF